MALAFRTSGAAGNTTSGTNPSGSITPVVGDQIYVFCVANGNTNASPTCSDGNTGGTYTRVFTALKNSSADTISCFVRNALIPNTTSTTVTVAIGAHTATEIVIVAVSGTGGAGAATIVQSATQNNQAGSTTPAPVFGATTKSTNLILSMVGNGTNPPNINPTTNWTRNQNIGQTACGLCVESISGSFENTTVTWGSTSASAFASGSLELQSIPSTAGINVSQVNAYAVTTPPVGINVSKVNAYAVTTPPVGINVSKVNAYAVTTPPVGINVSKVNAYVVLLPDITNYISSETLTLTFTETAAVTILFPITDSLDVTLTETAEVLNLSTTYLATDLIDVTFTEEVALKAKVNATDTISVTFTESGVVTLSKQVTDTLNITFTEEVILTTPGGGVLILVTDNLNVTLTEKAKISVVFFKTATEDLNVSFTESALDRVQWLVTDDLYIDLTEVGVSFIQPSWPRITQLTVEMAHSQPNESSARLSSLATEIAALQPNESYCVLSQVVVEYFVDRTKPFLWERTDITLTEDITIKRIIYVTDTLDITFEDLNVFNAQLFEVTPNPIPDHQPNIQDYRFDFGLGEQTWVPILWCIGFNFVVGSQIVWNGNILATTYINANTLTANVTPDLLISAGKTKTGAPYDYNFPGQEVVEIGKPADVYVINP